MKTSPNDAFMPLFGAQPTPVVAADSREPLPPLVGEQLGHAVVVGEEQIRDSRCRAGPRRPTASAQRRLRDADRRGDVLERAVAEVAEQVLAAAVVRRTRSSPA